MLLRLRRALKAIRGVRHPALRLCAVLLFGLIGLGGCARGSVYSGDSAANLTGSVGRPDPAPAQQRRAAAAEDDERPRAVPADPYKSVRYKGGRDPVSGVAPNLNGEMPPAAAPVAKPARVAGAPAAAATPGALAAAAGQPTIDVQPGDTLSGIAQRHKVSVSALMQANNLTRPHLAAGQKLVLPAK